MNVLRIIGLDDDNHCPCFRCEDGTVFDRPQALIEFLSKPHDCQVEVKMFAIAVSMSSLNLAKMFAIINQPVGGLEKYDMEQIDDMFYCMEGYGMAPEYISFEDMFNLFWNSANKLTWY